MMVVVSIGKEAADVRLINFLDFPHRKSTPRIRHILTTGNKDDVPGKGKDRHDDCVCITRLDDSDETLGLALTRVFNLLCINADIDITRDREEIIRYDGQYIEGVRKMMPRTTACMAF